MNKYEKGKIYRIIDAGYNKCYIGSTCGNLSSRMARHRYSYRNNNIDKTYTNSLFDEFGMENCKIELIENYPCSSKNELLKREGHYIQSTDCLNKQVAGRTREQWFEQNRDKYLQTKKEYYQQRKDDIREKSKFKLVCECGGCFQRACKARHERTKKHQDYLNNL